MLAISLIPRRAPSKFDPSKRHWREGAIPSRRVAQAILADAHLDLLQRRYHARTHLSQSRGAQKGNRNREYTVRSGVAAESVSRRAAVFARPARARSPASSFRAASDERVGMSYPALACPLPHSSHVPPPPPRPAGAPPVLCYSPFDVP